MIEDGDLSGNLTSAVTNVLQLDKASIYIAWSGTSVDGTFVLQARNGENAPWYDLALGGGAVTLSGNSGSHNIILNELPFSDMRLVYTQVGGTGVVDAVLTMKTVGA